MVIVIENVANNASVEWSATVFIVPSLVTTFGHQCAQRSHYYCLWARLTFPPFPEDPVYTAEGWMDFDRLGNK